jgi:hypothetical protein
LNAKVVVVAAVAGLLAVAGCGGAQTALLPPGCQGLLRTTQRAISDVERVHLQVELIAIGHGSPEAIRKAAHEGWEDLTKGPLDGELKIACDRQYASTLRQGGYGCAFTIQESVPKILGAAELYFIDGGEWQGEYPGETTINAMKKAYENSGASERRGEPNPLAACRMHNEWRAPTAPQSAEAAKEREEKGGE